jgi:hypothetical protein
LSAGILCKVQSQERDEGCKVNNYEEWKAGYSRDMPKLRNQDVPDREGLKRVLREPQY